MHIHGGGCCSRTCSRRRPPALWPGTCGRQMAVPAGSAVCPAAPQSTSAITVPASQHREEGGADTFLVNRTTTSSSSRVSQYHMGPTLDDDRHKFSTWTCRFLSHGKHKGAYAMNGNTYRSPVGPTLRRTFITFACGAGKVSAPGFSACSTANLMGTPLVPKSLRTVRQVSPAPVSYSLQCVSKHSMRFLQHYNSGQMTPVHTVISLFPLVQPAAYLPQRSQQSIRPRQRFTTHQPTTSVSGQGPQRSCRGSCPRLKAN